MHIQRLIQRELAAAAKAKGLSMSEADVPALTVRVSAAVEKVVENATNREPWYRSRVILGSIVSVLALGAGALGANVDAAAQGEIVDAIIRAVEAGSTLVAIGGSLYALWGRITARGPIGS